MVIRLQPSPFLVRRKATVPFSVKSVEFDEQKHPRDESGKFSEVTGSKTPKNPKANQEKLDFEEKWAAWEKRQAEKLPRPPSDAEIDAADARLQNEIIDYHNTNDPELRETLGSYLHSDIPAMREAVKDRINELPFDSNDKIELYRGAEGKLIVESVHKSDILMSLRMEGEVLINRGGLTVPYTTDKKWAQKFADSPGFANQFTPLPAIKKSLSSISELSGGALIKPAKQSRKIKQSKKIKKSHQKRLKSLRAKYVKSISEYQAISEDSIKKGTTFDDLKSRLDRLLSGLGKSDLLKIANQTGMIFTTASSKTDMVFKLKLRVLERKESMDRNRAIRGDKSLYTSIESAGRWLADRWAKLENRYGRSGALVMVLASLATFPIPFNITAIIAAAEAIRGVQGFYNSAMAKTYLGTNRPVVSKIKSSMVWRTKDTGQPCEQGERADLTGCIPKEDESHERREGQEQSTGERSDVGKPNDAGSSGPDGKAGKEKPRIITARSEFTKPGNPELVPERLRGLLREHQLEGTAKAIEALDEFGGFLLADGTGVGKTREALATGSIFLERGKKVLIVTKSEVIKPDWAKEKISGSFLDDSQAMGIDLVLNKDKPLVLGKVNITTYDRLKSFANQIDKDTLIIWDESHAIKNWQSARSKHAYAMNKLAGQVMYMSATPIDKPLHLPYLFRSKVFGFGSWDDTYTEMGLIQKSVNTPNGVIKKWEINPHVGAAEVYKRLSGLFDKVTESGLMLKREISFEGVEIGVENVPLPQEAHDLLKRIDDEIASRTTNPGLRKALSLMHQRRQLEPYKIAHTVIGAKKELAEGRQVVIFLSRVNESSILGDDDGEGEEEIVASSEGTAKSIREAFAKEGIDVLELHGGAKGKPEKIMADFQSGKKQVLIATIESGGTGINLDDRIGDKPRSMFIMTPPFSGMENVQAAGRIWRLNTKSKPRVKYLFTDTDVDRWNAALVGTKMKTLGATVQGELGALDISKAPSETIAREAVQGERYQWRKPLVRPKVTPSSMGQDRSEKPVENQVAKPTEQATTTINKSQPLKVSGNTYEHKEAIKAAGGRWNGDEKVWMIPSESIHRIEKLSGLRIEGQATKQTENKPEAAVGSASRYLISGNTYTNKEAIKAAGGRWDAARTGWMIPATAKEKLERLRGLIFSAEKHLFDWYIKEGFTGRKRDQAGREMCFQNGVHVPCGQIEQPKEKKPAQQEEPSKPKKGPLQGEELRVALDDWIGEFEKAGGKWDESQMTGAEIAAWDAAFEDPRLKGKVKEPPGYAERNQGFWGGKEKEAKFAPAPEGETLTEAPCCLYKPDPTADSTGDGVADSARVGVPAMQSPPPPKEIPRLPNLTEKEREAETRFADSFLDDPDGVADEYIRRLQAKELGDAPNIFNTDDAKMLSPDYNPSDKSEDESKNAKGKYNVAVHQTANAIAKKAFLKYLDKLPDDKKTVLVTSGGCASGKGFALANSPGTSELANTVGAIWDAAGEQNATENPWVMAECEKRGIKPIFAFVHADSSETWENPERGVVERAGKKGRMVDAKLFADSYALGAKNFKAFADNNQGKAQFIYLVNKGKPQLSDTMPEEALGVNSDEIYNRASKVLDERATRLRPSVVRGGSIGRRIWGEPTGNKQEGP